MDTSYISINYFNMLDDFSFPFFVIIIGVMTIICIGYFYNVKNDINNDQIYHKNEIEFICYSGNVSSRWQPIMYAAAEFSEIDYKLNDFLTNDIFDDLLTEEICIEIHDNNDLTSDW